MRKDKAFDSPVTQRSYSHHSLKSTHIKFYSAHKKLLHTANNELKIMLSSKKESYGVEIIETGGHNLKSAWHCYIIQDVSVSRNNKITKKTICCHSKHNNFP